MQHAAIRAQPPQRPSPPITLCAQHTQTYNHAGLLHYSVVLSISSQARYLVHWPRYPPSNMQKQKGLRHTNALHHMIQLLQMHAITDRQVSDKLDCMEYVECMALLDNVCNTLE